MNGANRSITGKDVQLVRYFANKYRRMAIEARIKRASKDCVVSLERSAEVAKELADLLQRMVTR